MQQKFNLTISKPCSEKFSQFKQTSTGGFCNSCQKNVIDFRKMSDEQVTKYFKNKTGKTCGYFDASQLNRTIETPELKQPTKFNLLRVAALVTISLTSLHNIQAQEQKPSTVIVQKTKDNKTEQTVKSGVVVTGVVSDESSVLPGANILLKGTSIGAVSNFDGAFEFPQVLKKGDVLVVSYLGYDTQNITIQDNQKPINILMTTDYSCVLMGEVEVNEVYKSKRSFWKRIKSIF